MWLSLLEKIFVSESYKYWLFKTMSELETGEKTGNIVVLYRFPSQSADEFETLFYENKFLTDFKEEPHFLIILLQHSPLQ